MVRVRCAAAAPVESMSQSRGPTNYRHRRNPSATPNISLHNSSESILYVRHLFIGPLVPHSLTLHVTHRYQPAAVVPLTPFPPHAASISPMTSPASLMGSVSMPLPHAHSPQSLSHSPQPPHHQTPQALMMQTQPQQQMAGPMAGLMAGAHPLVLPVTSVMTHPAPVAHPHTHMLSPSLSPPPLSPPPSIAGALVLLCRASLLPLC